MAATFLRPWYVLGPGHQWPRFLLPLYWALRLIPATKEGAERLGLVTIRQMIAALVHAVEDPVDGVRVIDVPAIRAAPMRLTPPI
jgi:nucleoside-diphosphate-sugar epimerase